MNEIVTHHAVIDTIYVQYCHIRCDIMINMHKSLAGVHLFFGSKSFTSQNWPIQNNFTRDTEDGEKKPGICRSNSVRKIVEGNVLTHTDSTNENTVFSSSLVFNNFDPKANVGNELKKMNIQLRFQFSLKKHYSVSSHKHRVCRFHQWLPIPL